MSDLKMPQPDSPESELPLPPATFEFFVLSMKMQAEMHLGLVHFGDEKERPEPDFRVARHTIDLLAMFQEKTRGNLTIDEQRLIENSLTELRFRFVQVMEATNKQHEPKDEPRIIIP
ncbi:MAG TPA: DUF1844 domain-containing protein [Bryobacteraceae bacterium]|nr:DUF1844 domain-containing protein [Bryobacteraceae bacterium]